MDGEEKETVVIKNPALAFMHCWSLGNNAKDIVKVAVASFSEEQLREAAMKLFKDVTSAGTFHNRKNTVERTAAEVLAQDIIDGLKVIDNSGEIVHFECDSVGMRSAKVSTILFSEDEPIIAAKMAIMEKTIMDLLEGQKTMFKIIAERLPEKSLSVAGEIPPQNPGTSFAEIVAETRNSQESLKRPERRSEQPPKKRLNSVVEEDEDSSGTDSDSWEKSREDKRKEKLLRRKESKKVNVKAPAANEKVEEKNNKKKEHAKKPSPVTVCTGSSLDETTACPGLAAPKSVFVSRRKRKLSRHV